MLDHSLEDGFIERDFKFENEVLWEVLYSEGEYNYSTRIWSKPLTPLPLPYEPIEGETILDPFDEPLKLPSKVIKLINFFAKLFKFNKNKSFKEEVEGPIKEKEDTIPVSITQFTAENPQESFNINASHNISTKKVEVQIAEEEHQRLLQEQKDDYLSDQRALHTYNLADFPLAEPELISKLAELHSKYFHLLSHLQDTHTPNDFVTAFRIQDRIAYLLDNQTLLYRTLTKKLIKYLERINEKLEKYYEDITLKREDLKKMNAQISRFNEYDRKTQSRINQAEQETNSFKEDLKRYNESLKELEPELQAESDTQSEKVRRSEDINVVEKSNDTIVY